MSIENPEKIIEQLKLLCPKFGSNLCSEDHSSFVSLAELLHAETNEVIAHVGDVCDEFYLILEGRIRLVDEGGNEVEVGRFDAGMLVGEMSFFDKKPRSLSLKVGKKDKLVALVISRKMYDNLCAKHPHLAINLLEFVIMSLDRLVRENSKDFSSMYKQVLGVGYR
ncbi:MAG: cyclic nucleotide-binding domain-containing protein [Cocleimonas sp.]|nr:cyclic nucleotide-binding domain-containing protein [Cocleimonas sp.]